MYSKHFYAAIATLVGTIIGAGVLGIPYVIAQAGFITGLINLIILGVVVLILYLYLGEVVLRTKGNHQLPGYAEIYLGKWGKKFMVFSMIFAIYGALLAYFIGGGESLFVMFKIGSPLLYSIIFYVIVSYIVYIGIKAVEKSELLLGIFVVSIIILISIFTIPKVNPINLNIFKPNLILVPFGVILFSLAGSIAIPEMKEELMNNRKLMKKAIILGALIPTFIYILFSIVIVGSGGLNTTEIATVGLAQTLGSKMFFLGNLFAVLAMATSFLTLGLALKEMYHYDFNLNKKYAWLLTIIPPLILFFILNKSFVGILGLTGGIAMGIEGVLVVLMFQKAKKLGKRKPEFSVKSNLLIEYGIMLVFFIGILYTLASFLKFI